MDFIVASLMKVRFWVILCPINFVGKIRDFVSDIAKGFAAQDGMEEQAARAAAVVIMSKPARQGMLFECLTQLHAEAGGLVRTSTRPTLCSDEPSLRVCMSVHLQGKSCGLVRSRFECLFSVTLLRGHLPDCEGLRRHARRDAAPEAASRRC